EREANEKSASLALANVADNANNALGRLTVPVLGRSGELPIAVHDAREGFENPSSVGPGQNVRAMRDSNGTLRVVAQRQARHAKNGRLFLKAAGVRQYDGGG